mmetsp:Transcript_3971/g.6976  ORF Transcript_3971/g.6976 Transcript_3971/m.6976 type:complete len:95 (-) Transcript_3971:107-391(-)
MTLPILLTEPDGSCVTDDTAHHVIFSATLPHVQVSACYHAPPFSQALLAAQQLIKLSTKSASCIVATSSSECKLLLLVRPARTHGSRGADDIWH